MERQLVIGKQNKYGYIQLDAKNSDRRSQLKELFQNNSAEMSDDAEYRCFVGGLSWSTSDKVLREEFDRFGGLIDAKVVVDRESGRSRGFGFVTFNDRQSMEDAIEKMRGIELDGRNISGEGSAAG